MSFSFKAINIFYLLFLFLLLNGLSCSKCGREERPEDEIAKEKIEFVPGKPVSPEESDSGKRAPELSREEYIEVSISMARDTNQTYKKMMGGELGAEEWDKTIKKIEEKSKISIEKLQDHHIEYSIELMDYLLEHPELKESVSFGLMGIGYWEDLPEAIESYINKHPEGAEEISIKFTKLTEWMP
jgi:hypothetical protein